MNDLWNNKDELEGYKDKPGLRAHAERLCENVKTRHCERFSARQSRWFEHGTRDCFGKKRLAMTATETFHTVCKRGNETNIA